MAFVVVVVVLFPFFFVFIIFFLYHVISIFGSSLCDSKDDGTAHLLLKVKALSSPPFSPSFSPYFILTTKTGDCTLQNLAL